MFESLKTHTCRVCGKNYILERNAFNCCPHNHNLWWYGGRWNRGPFKCPVCGKVYKATDPSNWSTVQTASYEAFTCCERPENKGFRNLNFQQREILSVFRFSMYTGPYTGPCGLQEIGRMPMNGKRLPPMPLRRGDPCPECHGTGRYNGVMCDRCAGTGKLLV